MSNSILISGGMLFLVAGAMGVLLSKWFFKKSIIFNIIAVLAFPILATSFLGLLVGIMGLQHVAWASPVSIALLLSGFAVVARMVQLPLSEMSKKVTFLSKGDLSYTFDKKYLKGSTETAVVMRQLTELIASFKNLATFAHRVGKGDLDADYTLLGENDTLGNAMLEMRKSLKKAKIEQVARAKEEEQRNWATAGLAKFAEILRKDNDNIEALSYNVISNMVKYLGVNQGGIFVWNEDNSRLEMKACYAFNRKKFVKKQIHPGEGLVGTCYLESEPIYMTDVPDSYITITSGLGEANPKAVYICPLKVNDKIFGVIELASFQIFEPYQLDFVKKVSESIAATISTVNVNIRTSRLLEQSKLQAEEMASQDKELRQNMEEMIAVQSTAEEKEHEMQQFHKAIFGTFCVLEFSTNACIVDINDNVLKLFGSTDRSDFVGKHITNFITQDEYEAVWNSVQQGKMHETVQQVEANGKINYLHQRYVPICNKKGELLRVIDLIILENG